MRSNRRIVVGMFLLPLTFAGLAQAEPGITGPQNEAADQASVPPCPPTEETLALIQDRYDAIQDLSADFEQRTRSGMLAGAAEDSAEVSRGQVLFAKPGRMRWSYREPEKSFVISDGESLWIYDVDGAQATRFGLEGGYLAGAALQFLFGAGRLSGTFKASTLNCGARGIEVELLPREDASYERLFVVAESESGVVSSTSIVDLFGNRTTIDFSKIVLNRSPGPEEFVFSRPKGVEVLDFTEPP